MNQIEHCPWCGSEISHAKFVEIETRIRADEHRKVLAHEVQIKEKLEQAYAIRLADETKRAALAATQQSERALGRQLAEQTKALTASNETVAKLKAQLDEHRKVRETQIETMVKAKVGEQRAVLERHRDKELAKRDAEHRREMERLQTRVKELNRRIEKKTANELGDIPEIDLHETLRGAFPDDKVVRVKPGAAGADIHQTVMHRSQACGLIIIDSKNHMAWRNDFVTKLRDDQVNAKADHAILSTNVFPSGKKELYILDGVIVVSPARVGIIVEILRNAIISLHKRGMSLEKRKSKMEELYRLIASDGCASRFEEANRLSNAILDLDVEEKKQHDKTWKERGRLATNLQRSIRGLEDEIDAIIGGSGVEEFENEVIPDRAEVPF